VAKTFRILRAFIRSRFKPLPAVLAHMVTYRCNMSCFFCDYWRRRDYELNLGEIKALLSEAADSGIAVYTVTGGEPLLRRDLGEILQYSDDCCLYNFLLTNGTKLRGKKLRVDFLSISLDTLSRERFYRIRGLDALKVVVDAVKWAAENYRTCINVVLTDENFQEVSDLIEFADSVGVEIAFEPVSDYFEGCAKISEENLRIAASRILELKKDYRCILNSKAYLKMILKGERFNCQSHILLRVSPGGEVVAPCYELDYIVVGNVLNKPLRELIGSESFIQGVEIAKSCRKNCYLSCYAEPSLAMCFRGLLGWLRELIMLRKF